VQFFTGIVGVVGGVVGGVVAGVVLCGTVVNKQFEAVYNRFQIFILP
jgi:hypothetical protein